MEANSQSGSIEEKGTFVRMRYTLRTGDGEYVKGHPREGAAHMEFFSGYRQVLPALEAQLLGRRAGERVELRLSPEEAFGPVRPDRVEERSLAEFPEGRELEEGRWVVARDPKTRASFGYFVRKKEEDRIVLDFNDPLAGKDLLYEIEILEARPATAEERALLRPCEGEGNGPAEEM